MSEAYWVDILGAPEEGGLYFHAETRGQAKMKGLGHFMGCDYIDIGTMRIPELDAQPFTRDNLGARWRDEWEGETVSDDTFLGYCKCEVCI